MAKVTISQIAKEAGVSKTAVSFAFNDPSQLAVATVRHIRETAERLGYTPDPIARSMTTRRTNALGLLLPQDIATALANPFYTQFIRGIGRVCGQVGQTLMLNASPDSPIELRCGGIPLVKGHIGRVGQFVAVKVDRTLRRPVAAPAL